MATVYFSNSDEWTYPNPTDELINSVFEDESYIFLFSNKLGIWINAEHGIYLSEEELKEYKKKWLKDKKAEDFYNNKCSELYLENKEMFDKIMDFGNKQKKKWQSK